MTGWVAIDDRDLVNELGGAALCGHFVRTNPSTGLTPRLSDQAVQILCEGSASPPPTRAPDRGGAAAARAAAATAADGAAAIADALHAFNGFVDGTPAPQQHPSQHSLQHSPARPPTAGGALRAVAEHSPMHTAYAAPRPHGAPVRPADYHPHGGSARSARRPCRAEAAGDRGDLLPPASFSCAGGCSPVATCSHL